MKHETLKVIRDMFPITMHTVYLNGAAESPLCRPVKERLNDYLDKALHAPHQQEAIRWEIKHKLARLLGGKPEDYALVSSTGIGSGMIAGGLTWGPHDNVVVAAKEHVNNHRPWQRLEKLGVEVRYVPLGHEGRLTPQAFGACIDQNTRLVSVAAVRFNSGYRTPLGEIAKIAHAHEALFHVDVVQAAGVVPIQAHHMGIDIMSCAGYKWLLGLPGTGFLYVNAKARKQVSPLLPGMFSAEDTHEVLNFLPSSQQYETGSIAYPLYHGWSAGLDLLISMGLETIYERIILLTDLIIKGLKDRHIQIKSPIRTKDERSSILFFDLGSQTDNEALYAYLLSQNVIISLREGCLRVSPSFFNAAEEILVFFAAIDRFLASRGFNQ